MSGSGDYISREAAIAAVDNYNHVYFPRNKRKLEELPAADVRPVVRGKWKEFSGRAFGMAEDGTRIALKMHTCSECKKSSIDAFYTNFCPNCGAWMEES